MDQPDLFPRPKVRVLTGEELEDALVAAMAPGIRHCREADLYLVRVCAREVAGRLIMSGLSVVDLPQTSIPLRE